MAKTTSGGKTRRTAAKRSVIRKAVKNSERVDLYQEITDQIVAEMEASTVPWAQPWDSSIALDTAEATFALPQNGATGRTYAGVNILILWLPVAKQGFAGQRWMTFQQVHGLSTQSGRASDRRRSLIQVRSHPRKSAQPSRPYANTSCLEPACVGSCQLMLP